MPSVGSLWTTGSSPVVTKKEKRRDSRQRDFALDLQKHAPELAA
jgi:hypothetical protein